MKLPQFMQTALWRVSQNKRKSAAIAVLILLVIFGLARLLSSGESTENVTRIDPAAEAEVAEEVVSVPSPLSGVAVSEELAERPVTAIVIENSPNARPQSGLSEAGFVFESIAEGGITRFVTLFQENAPDEVGPIRSLRPYFIDWALAFDASVAHVGGSVAALEEFANENGKDLDEFRYASSYFRSSDRVAPHNTYSTFDLLDALNSELGYTSSDFTPFARKDPAPAEVPTATQIDIDISTFTYNPSYTYNAETNSYDRSQGGEVHIDRNTNEQISPDVVIVAEIPNSIIEGGRYSYDVTGSGNVFIFQDGQRIDGRWSKSSKRAQMVFKRLDGSEIELNRGATWISAVSPGTGVSVTP